MRALLRAGHRAALRSVLIGFFAGLADFLCCTAPCQAAPSRAPVAAASLEAQREASVLSKQALHFFRHGEPRLAGPIYHRAYKLHPVAGYLYSAARAEEAAGQLQLAARDYGQLMATVPARDPFHQRAAARLAGLRGRVAQAPQRAQVQARTKTQAHSSAPPAVPPLLLSGGAALAVAAGSWRWAEADWSDLMARKTTENTFRGLTRAQAEAEARWVNQRMVAAYVLVGLGATATAIGGWLWWRQRGAGEAADKASTQGLQLLPIGPRGLGMTARLRF